MRKARVKRRGRDRAIDAYCATFSNRSRTGSKRTHSCTATVLIRSRVVKLLAIGLALLATFATADSPAASDSLPAPSGAADPAVQVTADDASDAYRVSGGVLLTSDPAPVEAATCTTCHWRFVHVCATGVLEDRAGCLTSQCPTREATVEVWRADAAEPPAVGDPAWVYRGITCLDAPPVAGPPLIALVRDAAERAVPAAMPATLPAGTTLTGLQTRFLAGQPTPFDAIFDVAGQPVRLHAVPIWTWDPGDGSGATSRASHTFRHRGVYRIRLETRWSAEFETAGVRGIPIGAPITQTAWADLRVREARGFRQRRGA